MSKVDGLDLRVFYGRTARDLCELEGRAVGHREGEMVAPRSPPGSAGEVGRRSACSMIGFSLKQITGC